MVSTLLGVFASQGTNARSGGQRHAVAGGDALILDHRTRRRAVPEGPTTELLPAVRSDPTTQVGPFRHDPARIEVGMHDVIVLLDLYEVGGVTEARRLEEIAGVGPEHGELAQLVPIALEVIVVHRVEPDQRREEPDIRLGDRVSHQVPLTAQPLGEPIEPGEQAVVRGLVGLLRASETTRTRRY